MAKFVVTSTLVVVALFLWLSALDGTVAQQRWRLIGMGSRNKKGNPTASTGRQSSQLWQQWQRRQTVRPRRRPKTTRKPTAAKTTPSVILTPTPLVKELDARIEKFRGSPEWKHRFVPPHILERFRRVKGLGDFVREFRPKGVTVERRVMPGVPVTAVRPGEAGIRGDAGMRGEAGMPGGAGVKGGTREVLHFDVASPLRMSSESNEIRQPSSELITPRCELKEFLREMPYEEKFDGIMFPPCVKVSECSGCCVNTYYMECAPIRTVVIPQIAFKISFSGPHETEPVSINVTHHAQCGCRCKVKATDCLPSQTYSPTNCQCECLKRAQSCPAERAWDAVSCMCKCASRRNCTSRRRYWDERTCTCACKNDPCAFGQRRHMNSCRCVESFWSRFSVPGLGSDDDADAA